LIHSAEIEILKAWNLRNVMHKELINILDNLAEAVITKNKDKIGLCNETGNRLLRNIQESCKLGHSSVVDSISSYIQDPRTNDDIKIEKKTLKVKMFKLFEDKEV
jgi:hypothetical protein